MLGVLHPEIETFIMLGVLLPSEARQNMSELTDAEMTLIESTYNGKNKDDWSINRWTKKGDRLYLDGPAKFDKHGIYADLETQTVEGAPSSSWKTDVSIDGDELTISIEKGKVTTKTYVFVVKLEGGDFEDADSDEDNEIVTDGGEDATDYAADETIETAINQHDDPDHEDATTVEEVRELLATLQYGVAEENWDLYMDHIEDGSIEVVADCGDVLVLSTGEHRMFTDEIEAIHDVDDTTMDVVSGVLHDVAKRLTNYNWGYSYPLVIKKPEGEDAGQRYVDAIVNSLIRQGLSPGQAWAIYGVKIRGNSRNQWASRCGYNDHSAVSEAVRKGLDKLPASWSDE